MPIYRGPESYQGNYVTKFIRLRSGIFIPQLGHNMDHKSLAELDRILEEILTLRRLSSSLIDGGQASFSENSILIFSDSLTLRIPVHPEARPVTIEEFSRQSHGYNVVDQGMYEIYKPQ